MKYAVIALSGSQYRVQEKDILTIDNLNKKEGETGTITDVLLTVDGENVKVGTPNIEKASVDYKVINNHRGEKIRVFKYQAKSRYRLTKGFRADLTKIEITKLNF